MSFEQAVQEAVEEAQDRNFTESVDLVVNFTGLDLSDPENRLNDDLRLPYRPDEEVRIAVIGDTLVNATDSADREITEEELENIFDEPESGQGSRRRVLVHHRGSTSDAQDRPTAGTGTRTARHDARPDAARRGPDRGD
jgi:Ribosomal protein L1